MNFELNKTQIELTNALNTLLKKFDDDYWLKCDTD